MSDNTTNETESNDSKTKKSRDAKRAEKMSADQRKDAVQAFITDMMSAAKSGDSKTIDKVLEKATHYATSKKLQKALSDGYDSAREHFEGAKALEIMGDAPWGASHVESKLIQISVGQLMSKIEHGEVVMKPDFQREFVWSTSRSSQLIESILLAIPLPKFFVLEDDKGRWVLVDGLQRTHALQWFVTAGQKLRGCQMVPGLNRLTFDGLPRTLQRRITECQLTFDVIQKGTPDDMMFATFNRLNTGGMKLSGQEIRTATHQGPAVPWLRNDLAEMPSFLEVTNGKVNPKRQADVEFILRALSWRLFGVESYKRADMNAWLNKAMSKLNSDDELFRDLTVEFDESCITASKVWGDHAFRRPRVDGQGFGPPSKALFEVIISELMRLTTEQREAVEDNAKDLVAGLLAALKETNDDEDGTLTLTDAVASATRDVKRVITRFRIIRALICQAAGIEPEEIKEPEPEDDESGDGGVEFDATEPAIDEIELKFAKFTARSAKEVLNAASDNDECWFAVNTDDEPALFLVIHDGDEDSDSVLIKGKLFPVENAKALVKMVRDALK